MPVAPPPQSTNATAASRPETTPLSWRQAALRWLQEEVQKDFPGTTPVADMTRRVGLIGIQMPTMRLRASTPGSCLVRSWGAGVLY